MVIKNSQPIKALTVQNFCFSMQLLAHWGARKNKEETMQQKNAWLLLRRTSIVLVVAMAVATTSGCTSIGEPPGKKPGVSSDQSGPGCLTGQIKGCEARLVEA